MYFYQPHFKDKKSKTLVFIFEVHVYFVSTNYWYNTSMFIISILSIILNILFKYISTWIIQCGESTCSQLLWATVNPEFTEQLNNNTIPITSITERTLSIKKLNLHFDTKIIHYSRFLLNINPFHYLIQSESQCI